MLKKSVVLYMDADLIDSASSNPAGAACSKCMLFISPVSECEILIPSNVDAKGVCCLFVPGPPATRKRLPAPTVPQDVAGYTAKGPTLCGTCSKFVSPNACEVVEGEIEYGGCCNGWDKGSNKPELKRYMSSNQMRQYLEPE